MSVTYMAFICYPRLQMGDSLDSEPEIKFEQPEGWKYEKVLPIQFSILHGWTDRDKGLYP
jgi:hypothetical protein